MHHVSAAIAAAVEEDRVNPPPPAAELLLLEVEGYERSIKAYEKQGKKGDETSIMWMEAMTRRDLYRLATGKGLEDPVDVSRVEKTALAKLFTALSGCEWNRKFGWLGLLKSQTRPEIPMFVASASLYHGVETSKLMGNGLTTGLRLAGVGARGEIPKQVGDFETLKTLELQWNMLTGVLPKELGALEALETLNLSGNSLRGELDPEVFSSLPNLRLLDLSSNRFTGHIPDAFQRFSVLKCLDLSNNALVGTCPRSLGKCIKLEKLNLSDNQLEGELLTAVFGPLTKLKDVNLSNNNFSGHGIVAFAGCSQLQRLQLAENNLTGHLTSEVLHGLQKLEILYLQRNRMGGHIPKEICSLKTLRRINLTSNFFRGSLPAAFGNLVNLETLLILDNEIIGPMPRSFSCLTKLRDFGIVKNYPSENFRLQRAFKTEEFERIFVDGPAMGLNSVVWEHEEVYGEAPKNESRFELFERRLYKQRGLPAFLGKMPEPLDA